MGNKDLEMKKLDLGDECFFFDEKEKKIKKADIVQTVTTRTLWAKEPTAKIMLDCKLHPNGEPEVEIKREIKKIEERTTYIVTNKLGDKRKFLEHRDEKEIFRTKEEVIEHLTKELPLETKKEAKI